MAAWGWTPGVQTPRTLGELPGQTSTIAHTPKSTPSDAMRNNNTSQLWAYVGNVSRQRHALVHRSATRSATVEIEFSIQPTQGLSDDPSPGR